MSNLRVLLMLTAVSCLLVACTDDEPTVPTATTTASTSVTSTSTAPSPTVTVDEQGIGKLRLGMTVAQAQATGQIGTVEPGCELAGPGEQAADLHVGAATGTVTFEDGALAGVMVRSGAETAAGVGPGSTLTQIQRAYAEGFELKTDESYKDQFGFTLVSVLRGATQLFDFNVDVDSQMVREVWVPRVRLCE